jgi:hypothetical protein
MGPSEDMNDGAGWVNWGMKEARVSAERYNIHSRTGSIVAISIVVPESSDGIWICHINACLIVRSGT